MTFSERYGPWAVVAGASEGLGAAFSRALVARGLHVALVARRVDPLEALAEELRGAGAEIRVVSADLASGPDALAELDLDVHLLIYNAAFSPIGDFFSVPLADHLRAIDVNVRGPVTLAHTFGRRMNGRGGVVLMSSLAGLQGSALLSTYAASKAFNLVLGESLVHEAHGLDVLVSCAGAIDTPAYRATGPIGSPPGIMTPEAVAEATLNALGKRAVVIPGAVNRLSTLFLQKVIPRRWASRTISSATRKMYPKR